MEVFDCPCEWHTRMVDPDGPRLPLPVLFQPKAVEHSFWLWYVRSTPSEVVGAVLLDPRSNPYVREFRGFYAACKHVRTFYNLPLSDQELKTLSECGMVKTSNDGQWQRLSDFTLEGRYEMIPEMFGQSSICSAWKTTSSHAPRP